MLLGCEPDYTPQLQSQEASLIIIESDIMLSDEDREYLISYTLHGLQEYSNYTKKKFVISQFKVLIVSDIEYVNRLLFNPPKKNLSAAYSNNVIYLQKDVLTNPAPLYHELAHMVNDHTSDKKRTDGWRKADELHAQEFEIYLSEIDSGLQRQGRQ